MCVCVCVCVGGRGRKPYLVLIFWDNSQFSPYILIVVNLVPTIKLLTENAYMTNGLHC